MSNPNQNLRMQMKELLDAEELLEFRPGRTYAKWAFLASVSALFLYAFLKAEGIAAVFAFILFMAASTGLVMMGHESGHGSVSKNKAVNDLLGWLSFPFFAGLPMHFWKWRHNTMHHAYPNMPGKDPDVSMQPLAGHAGEAGTWFLAKLIQKDQALTFWPFASLLGVAMRLDGVRFLITQRNNKVGGGERARDWLAIVLHLVAWIWVPQQFGYALGDVLRFYFLWTLCEGILLAAIFSPAHIPMPLFKEAEDNFLLQLQTTQNLRTNRILSYLMIGLDYQVEHHLFPRMSHMVTPRAAALIEKFCTDKGLPYHWSPWGRALWDTTIRMRELPGYSPEERPPRLAIDL